jgi:hypothetical protein
MFYLVKNSFGVVRRMPANEIQKEKHAPVNAKTVDHEAK